MPCCRHASSSVAPSGTRTVIPSTVTSTSRRGASRNTALMPAPSVATGPGSVGGRGTDQAESHRRLGGADGRLTQATDGGVTRHRGDIVQQSEFPLGRANRGAAQQPAQQLLLTYRADPARHALPT